MAGLHLQKEYFAKFYEDVRFDHSNVAELIGKKQEEYTILLAHTPVYFEEYAKWGANLVCSGHVHGGIVILPFLGGVISTTYELFPKYDHGQFQIDNTKMVLSRGLGMHTIKLRLFNKPEISVIKLLRFADESGDIADPWYTGDFDATYNDVVRGCKGLLKKLGYQNMGYIAAKDSQVFGKWTSEATKTEIAEAVKK